MLSTVIAVCCVAQIAAAQTADDVLTRMTDDERFAYISGVIEGLAAARWAAERPDSSGMTCIYDWYFGENDEVHLTTTEWLARNRDQRVGLLMYVLTQRECPSE